MRNAPALHGRDHRPGGSDPIPGVGGTGVYTYWEAVVNSQQSTTSTVINPGGQTREQEVADVFPMWSIYDWIDDEFFAYDWDYNAVTILQAGVYDVTLMGMFDNEAGAGNNGFSVDFNRSIELRIGEKVEFVDLVTAIPRSEFPLGVVSFSGNMTDFMPAGSWAPPETDGLWFTGALKISYRIRFDPNDGEATVQGFYSQDDAGGPSLWCALQIIRLTDSVTGPVPAP